MLHLNISLTDFMVIGTCFVPVLGIGLSFSNHKNKCGVFSIKLYSLWNFL